MIYAIIVLYEIFTVTHLFAIMERKRIFNDYYTMNKSDKKNRTDSSTTHKRNDYHRRYNFILNEKTILLAIIGVLGIVIICLFLVLKSDIAVFIANMYDDFIDFWVTKTKNKVIQSEFMGFVLIPPISYGLTIRENFWYIKNPVLKLIITIMIAIIIIMVISYFGLWNYYTLMGAMGAIITGMILSLILL